MTRFRHNLVLSGLGGLLACGLLTAFSVRLVSTNAITPPLPYPLVTLLFVLIFGAFSLAEIPLMVFAMRRLSVERPANHRIVFGLNGFYVFFAAIYGIPVLLFTGSVAWGLTLCGLGLVRFATSLILIVEPTL